MKEHLKLACKKGGFVSLRHNQVRDLTIGMLTEAGCKDIVSEPQLAPLTGETFYHKTANTADDARADISCRGLWNTLDKTFLDVRVFHHDCPSNSNQKTPAVYRKHEQEKKRGYNARIIEVEKATFTPLVFSTHGSVMVWVRRLNPSTNAWPRSLQIKEVISIAR